MKVNPDIEVLKAEYLNGLSIRKALDKHNMSGNECYWINKVRSSLGIKHGGNNKPFNYFETIDSYQKAYLLGFIAGDGFIHSKSNRVSIDLKSSDSDFLDRIKEEFLSYDPLLKYTNQHIYRGSTSSYALHIHNLKLKQDLSSYGLLPYKSNNLGRVLPLIADEFRGAYICGLLDSDGCVSYRERGTKKELAVYFCGTYEEMDEVFEYLISLGIRANISRHTSINNHSKVSIYSKNSLKILSELYSPLKFSLLRKSEKLKTCLIELK